MYTQKHLYISGAALFQLCTVSILFHRKFKWNRHNYILFSKGTYFVNYRDFLFDQVQ